MDVVADENGFGGAGEGGLLDVPSLVSAMSGFAKRTCLLLKGPREFSPPPLPFTAALLAPLCSRFAAFSNRSASKVSGELSVGDVPGRIRLSTVLIFWLRISATLNPTLMTNSRVIQQ